jgi:hypothetical protein
LYRLGCYTYFVAYIFWLWIVNNVGSSVSNPCEFTKFSLTNSLANPFKKTYRVANLVFFCITFPHDPSIFPSCRNSLWSCLIQYMHHTPLLTKASPPHFTLSYAQHRGGGGGAPAGPGGGGCGWGGGGGGVGVEG